MTPNKTVLLLAASGLALTLGGCKVDNRPLLARDAAPADAYAGLPQPGLPGGAYQAPAYGAQGYPASYLPPERAYPYAERAYGLDRAFYQAPPDYGFAYADEQPWVWEAADDSLMFAEPYGDDYRFYYYEPGAAYPYFVRDADYGYAYGQNGALLALFDAAGALLGADSYDRYYPAARQYWSRGYDLHTTFGRAPRYPVDQAVWSQRAPRLERLDQRWLSAPDRQPGWRQWRAAAGPAVLQHYTVQRPARAAALDEGRHDNGLHLGWDRGRHEGWNKPSGQQAFAAGPPARFQAPREAGRQDHGPDVRAAAQPRFSAPSVERHGRDAAFRGPERHDAPAPAPAVLQPHGGEGHGHHGGEPPHVAQAAPSAAPQAAGNWTDNGHGRHGGGERVAQAAPPPQAQQPQAQPHGGGQEKHAQGDGKDKGQDKHGRGH